MIASVPRRLNEPMAIGMGHRPPSLAWDQKKELVFTESQGPCNDTNRSQCFLIFLGAIE